MTTRYIICTQGHTLDAWRAHGIPPTHTIQDGEDALIDAIANHLEAGDRIVAIAIIHPPDPHGHPVLQAMHDRMFNDYIRRGALHGIGTDAP